MEKFSVMSRSRSQGTEVTIVTGVFSSFFCYSSLGSVFVIAF